MAKRQLIRAGIRRQDLARANGRRRQLLSLAKPSAGIRRRLIATANGKMREISTLDKSEACIRRWFVLKSCTQLRKLVVTVTYRCPLRGYVGDCKQPQPTTKLSLSAKFRRAILCKTARKTRFVKEGAHHATFRFCGTAIFAKRKC